MGILGPYVCLALPCLALNCTACSGLNFFTLFSFQAMQLAIAMPPKQPASKPLLHYYIYTYVRTC